MFAIKVMRGNGYEVFNANTYIVHETPDGMEIIGTEGDTTHTASVNSVAYIMNSAGSTIDVVRAKGRTGWTTVGDSGPDIVRPSAEQIKQMCADINRASKEFQKHLFGRVITSADGTEKQSA